MLQLRSDSPATTHAIAAAVASLVRTGDVIVLAGEMGAGKTAFAQGFGAALGVTDHMTSPTYNLVHSHPAGKLTLHHADLYRLSTQHEVADLAFAELAESDGVLLVEWGDVIGAAIGDHLLIRLERDDDTTDTTDTAEPAGLDPDVVVTDDAPRLVTVTAMGRDWATRWDRLTRALEAWSC
jgi:tRNA threonylcarbamoyladenosine biosynthesis protein TsaE